MRSYILSYLFIILVLAGCNSGSGKTINSEKSIPAEGEEPEISFSEYEHNFGRVTEGEKVAHIFSFTNKGKGSLVLSSASTTCGCTVTKFDRNPVPPGDSGSLEVVFDTSARSGVQSKTVTVRSNASKPVVILKITAEVISK